MHDIMVGYLIQQIGRKFCPRLVSAKNRNIPPGSLKPDIVLKEHNKLVYLDVGFTNCEKQYYDAKDEKYKKAQVKYEVHPIIF